MKRSCAHFLNFPKRVAGRLAGRRVLGLLCLVGGLGAGHAQEAGRSTITEIGAIWAMSAAERAEVHPLRIEGRVSYVDIGWRNMWFEHGGAGHFAPLASDPPALRNGMRFRLEGTLIPQEGLSASRTTLTVIEESGEPDVVFDATATVNEIPRYDRRNVVVEGAVDVQQLMDDTHLRIMLMVDRRPVVCWVSPRDPRALPDYRGRVLRVTGLYSGRIDPGGSQSTIEIWVADESRIIDLGPVSESAWFSGRESSVGAVGTLPLGERVMVRGVVAKRRGGEGLQLRGVDGDLWVQSNQEEVFNRGAPVVVVGEVAVDQSRRVLDQAVIRLAEAEEGDRIRAEMAAVPGRVEQIREMSMAEAAEGRDVELLGTVTWMFPGFDFFYLSDYSGGTRVRFDPAVFHPPALYKFLLLRGRTVMGPSGPEVELMGIEDKGARGHPEPLSIDVKDALAGGVEAQWVEMRGFLREVVSEGDWRRLRMTSPSGDFVVLLHSPVNFVANPGSLLRVRGVLETTRDERGLVRQVQLRTPFLHDIHLEEESPADPFSVRALPIGNLERLAVLEDMLRVHVQGRVVHARANGSFVIENDGGAEVFSRLPGPMSRNQVVDVVGVLGREGVRIVLRDGLVREATDADWPEAAPRSLEADQLLDWRNEARLVALEGRVIATSVDLREMRLALVSAGTSWEAQLPILAGEVPTIVPQIGSVVRLTGVGRLILGRSLRPESFALELRDPADIEVLARPHWLTAQLALILMGGLAVVAAIAAGAVLVLRRQVNRQTQQMREQLELQHTLEAQLERDRRYRAVGALAGGIAHDFNNHLTAIIGNLSLLQADPLVSVEAKELADDAEQSARRARDVTRQLSTLAKGGQPVTSAVAVTAWLERAVRKVLPTAWSVRMAVESDFNLALDESQMTRAVKTLVKHLVQRCGARGSLQVEVNRVADRQLVSIRLGDDGPVPDEPALEGIFDPYGESVYGDERFDMALAFSIVKRHGGDLSARAVNGMQIEVLLPLVESRPPFAVPAKSIVAPVVSSPERIPEPRSALRVLVLEDEPSVVRILERMLAKFGHEGVILPEGQACIERFIAARQAGRGFDLVILDLTVPAGMGGLETLAQL